MFLWGQLILEIRQNFLHKYLDLEFIVEYLYRVLSVPRTSASCAES